MMLASGTPLFGQPEPVRREYELKADFLYHFTQLVEWPETAVASDRIVLCLLGDDPFGAALDDLSGKEVGDRRLVVRRLDGVREAREAGACQILFIRASENSDKMAELADSRVLTVGETERFTAQGGIIRFYKVRNRLRVEINLNAARKAGVKISSRMLNLAKVV